MELSEEQRRRMEENKLKAIAKRKLDDGNAVTPTLCVNKAESFYKTSLWGVLDPSGRTSIRGASSLKSAPPTAQTFARASPSIVRGKSELLPGGERFVVRAPYSDQLIATFKTMTSSQYNVKERTWTFSVSEHEALLKKVASLKPNVVLEPLPSWIVKIFAAASRTEEVADEGVRERIEPTLLNSLMPFQVDGVDFALKKKGRILLADDMGLGKTIQALGVASAYRHEWPLLIVCPSSVRFSWKTAVIKWIPSLPEEEINVVTTGKDDINSTVVITSFDLLARKEADLRRKAFKVVIVDESHFLKNHRSNRTQAAEKIFRSASRLLMLTGTPALSRPMELFSQIALIAPTLFNHAVEFGMRYCNGKKISFGHNKTHFDFTGSSNMEELRELLLKTCMIRRLKSDVLTQLPAKQRQMIVLDPNAVKTKTKEMESQAKRMGLKSISQSERRGVLLEWFNMTGKAKTKAVLDFLKDLLEGDKKFICFAHHQHMLNEIEDFLDKQEVRFVRVDGSTSSDLRDRHCNQFQNDDVTRVALLSITAANAGLTLTSAQVVVFAELFWNPGVLTQAEDRAHRIGQTDCVTVKYLVAKGTADDELWPLLQRKLDTLNKAGLSKDNFLESDAFHAKVADDGPESSDNTKITDYFSNSVLEDIENWNDNDDFMMEPAKTPSKMARLDA